MTGTHGASSHDRPEPCAVGSGRKGSVIGGIMIHWFHRIAVVMLMAVLVWPQLAAGQSLPRHTYLPLVQYRDPIPPDVTVDYSVPALPGVYDEADFRLWIPGTAPQIRGLIVYTPGYG